VSGISGLASINWPLEIARGRVPGQIAINKFGKTTNADNGVPTDVHDGANSTDIILTWVAPTVARIHQIKSSSADDAAAGTGAQTIRVFGLTSWDTAEEFEDIILNGVTNVPTTKSYVIIYRMTVLTKGAADINVGKITATADTDATITAMILASVGQTRMAILGVPSIQTAFISSYFMTTAEAASNPDVSMTLLTNLTPDVELLNFISKHTLVTTSVGSSHISHPFDKPEKVVGPAIIKLNAISTSNNTDIDAGFDVVLVNK